jgi:hypothetical protein
MSYLLQREYYLFFAFHSGKAAFYACALFMFTLLACILYHRSSGNKNRWQHSHLNGRVMLSEYSKYFSTWTFYRMKLSTEFIQDKQK